jgi:hypothetical protein
MNSASQRQMIDQILTVLNNPHEHAKHLYPNGPPLDQPSIDDFRSELIRIRDTSDLSNAQETEMDYWIGDIINFPWTDIVEKMFKLAMDFNEKIKQAKKLSQKNG